MGTRLLPARSDEYDYGDLRQRLREACVNAGIKIDGSRINETAIIADQLGVDPEPFRNTLRAPADERVPPLDERSGPIAAEDVVRLHEFCDELIQAIEAEVDIEAIRERIRNPDPGKNSKEYLDEKRYAYERAHGYALTIGGLCQKAREWGFGLRIG